MINDINYQYANLLVQITRYGEAYDDPNRPGIKRIEQLPATVSHKTSKLANGYFTSPGITLKKIYTKSIVTELIWFLRGDTDIKYLVDNGCNIWNKDAYAYYLNQYKLLEDGYHSFEPVDDGPISYEEFMGRVKSGDNTEPFLGHTAYGKYGSVGYSYGHNWGCANDSDQLLEALHKIKKNKYSSSAMVSAWNPGMCNKYMQALEPCHTHFQLHYGNGGLNLTFYMRSTDVVLGLPFNMVSYHCLLLLCNEILGLEPGAVTCFMSKPHIYDNHLGAAKEMISRLKVVEGTMCNVKLSESLKSEIGILTDGRDGDTIPLDDIIYQLKPSDFIFDKIDLGKLDNKAEMVSYG
jgi:thymidylate synthase